jgi:hypothetical protein
LVEEQRFQMFSKQEAKYESGIRSQKCHYCSQTKEYTFVGEEETSAPTFMEQPEQKEIVKIVISN